MSVNSDKRLISSGLGWSCVKAYHMAAWGLNSKAQKLQNFLLFPFSSCTQANVRRLIKIINFYAHTWTMWARLFNLIKISMNYNEIESYQRKWSKNEKIPHKILNPFCMMISVSRIDISWEKLFTPEQVYRLVPTLHAERSEKFHSKNSDDVKTRKIIHKIEFSPSSMVLWNFVRGRRSGRALVRDVRGGKLFYCDVEKRNFENDEQEFRFVSFVRWRHWDPKGVFENTIRASRVGVSPITRSHI